MTTPRVQPPPINHNDAPKRSSHLTLIDHLHEIRARLFWIVLALVIASGTTYYVQDQIMAALMRPLGGQKLVYLTPIGGFNFLFKVSMYVGIGLILPVIIYHLYRFLEPLMDKKRKRSAFFYITTSFLLAVSGGCFAYFGGLPAAMHFLTSFNIQNVTAMLTADSYLTFVITYVLGFAALFQIPLVLMIVNTIKPLPPKKLLGFQRFVILIAFILAAIISPTPDITNQAILAVPIIIMYQIGVLLVWVQSRGQRRSDAAAAARQQPTPKPIIRRTAQLAPVHAASASPQPSAQSFASAKPKLIMQKPALVQQQQIQRQPKTPVMDITRAPRQINSRPVIPNRPTQPRQTPTRRPMGRSISIDGFAI